MHGKWDEQKIEIVRGRALKWNKKATRKANERPWSYKAQCQEKGVLVGTSITEEVSKSNFTWYMKLKLKLI